MSFTPASPIWTEADLTEVAAAIKALAMGEKVVSVTIGSLGRQVEYHATDLGQLDKLYNRIYEYLAAAAESTNKSATIRVITSKRP